MSNDSASNTSAPSDDDDKKAPTGSSDNENGSDVSKLPKRLREKLKRLRNEDPNIYPLF